MSAAPVFDLSRPGVRVTPSTFGGGWAVPITQEGTDALYDYFRAKAEPLAPLGGTAGYIVEPSESPALAEYLRSHGVAWEVEQ